MNKIIKWLRENNIEFTYFERSGGTNKYITIVLEKDVIWINGFGEEMRYTKQVNIWQNTHKKYRLSEKYGYLSEKELAENTKADIIIKALAKRFEV